eukprot:gene13340-3896_t
MYDDVKGFLQKSGIDNFPVFLASGEINQALVPRNWGNKVGLMNQIPDDSLSPRLKRFREEGFPAVHSDQHHVYWNKSELSADRKGQNVSNNVGALMDRQ